MRVTFLNRSRELDYNSAFALVLVVLSSLNVIVTYLWWRHLTGDGPPLEHAQPLADPLKLVVAAILIFWARPWSRIIGILLAAVVLYLNVVNVLSACASLHSSAFLSAAVLRCSVHIVVDEAPHLMVISALSLLILGIGIAGLVIGGKHRRAE